MNWALFPPKDQKGEDKNLQLQGLLLRRLQKNLKSQRCSDLMWYIEWRADF